MRFLLAVVLLAAPAHADRPPPPCPDCVLEVPAAEGPRPLLVVLHGDRQRAPAVAARWRAAARDRGWVLLALQCPATEQCKDSWWKWDGDVQWVKDQVAAVAERVAIDRTRTYLAGWSGGATYLTMHAQAWTDTFAAVVMHGGGRHPNADDCPAPALPAYFLVGDKNPLHELAIGSREFFERCRADVVWDLVRGGDHAREDRALDGKKALAILDWLAAHSRR
jgi:poly(3-hydroxybutyrate) depolymerase